MIDSIRNTYLDHQKVKTLKHVEEVAETAVRLAVIHGLDQEKVRLAALLHDISAVMTPQVMYDLAVSRRMPLDPAEEKYHFLLHHKYNHYLFRHKFL